MNINTKCNRSTHTINTALLWSEDIGAGPKATVGISRFSIMPEVGEYIITKCGNYAHEIINVVKKKANGLETDIIHLSPRATHITKIKPTERSAVGENLKVHSQEGHAQLVSYYRVTTAAVALAS